MWQPMPGMKPTYHCLNLYLDFGNLSIPVHSATATICLQRPLEVVFQKEFGVLLQSSRLPEVLSAACRQRPYKVQAQGFPVPGIEYRQIRLETELLSLSFPVSYQNNVVSTISYIRIAPK